MLVVAHFDTRSVARMQRGKKTTTSVRECATVAVGYTLDLLFFYHISYRRVTMHPVPTDQIGDCCTAEIVGELLTRIREANGLKFVDSSALEVLAEELKSELIIRKGEASRI